LKKTIALCAVTATAFLTTALLPVGSAWAMQTTSPFAGGDGTAASPYQIASSEQLEALASHPQYWSDDFVLTANLGSGRASDNIDVTPIGTQNQPFTGTFDGGNHEIWNLRVADSGDDTTVGSGLFGWTDGATIENVVLDSSIVGGKQDVGSLVGHAGLGTLIRDCSESDGLVYGSEDTGALVGNNAGTVEDSSATGGEIQTPLVVGGWVPPIGSAFGTLIGLDTATGSATTSTSSARLGGSYLKNFPDNLIGEQMGATPGQLPEVPFAGLLPLIGALGLLGWKAARRRTS